MAGRWFGRKWTVEECHMLDVSSLHRKGFLQHGKSGTWIWSRDGEQVGGIGLRMEGGALVLRYSITQRDEQKRDYYYRVPVAWTACNYGGSRPWFVCPGVVSGVACNRRVAKLYTPPNGDLFLCRHCWNLSYVSRRESRPRRVLRKIQKIYWRLGVEWWLSGPFPWQPKGMHSRTYTQLLNKARELESTFCVLIRRKYEPMIRRSERMAEQLERMARK